MVQGNLNSAHLRCLPNQTQLINSSADYKRLQDLR